MPWSPAARNAQAARLIADRYKERWQIGLFFKWIKQNLKVKTFLGTSKNAVLIQIWIVLRVYLLLAFLKFKARQPNFFDRRDLLAFLKPPEIQLVQCRQFSLF